MVLSSETEMVVSRTTMIFKTNPYENDQARYPPCFIVLRAGCCLPGKIQQNKNQASRSMQNGKL